MNAEAFASAVDRALVGSSLSLTDEDPLPPTTDRRVSGVYAVSSGDGDRGAEYAGGATSEVSCYIVIRALTCTLTGIRLTDPFESPFTPFFIGVVTAPDLESSGGK